MSAKRKRQQIPNSNPNGSSEPNAKRRRLEHDQDKPLRYLFLFTHTLIANYEEILKKCWIKSFKYILNKNNYSHSNIFEYINKLNVSTFIEDDLMDKLLNHLSPLNNLSYNIKYDIMKIKDKFFEDNIHKIELKKGIRILLRELRENFKWNICLIHKDSRETFNLILNDIGLRGYFNAFVCASSITNYNRPYKQIYEQSISRCRIFKKQCLCLTNNNIETLESIHFGIYPIFINNNNDVILDGEYFLINKCTEWMKELKKLLISMKDISCDRYSINELKNNNGSLKDNDNVVFCNDNGKIYNGKIQKIVVKHPVKIFRLTYIDENNVKKTSLKQSYLIWKLVKSV